jgi:hypothetical protein
MGARKGAKIAAVASSPLTKWGRGAERSEGAIEKPTIWLFE